MTRIMRAARASVALPLAIMLSACATEMGKNFNDAYARAIKPGQTTKAEVRSNLGRPDTVIRGTDVDTWKYSYYKGGGFGGWFGATPASGQQQKSLVVTFKGDVVADAKYRQDLPAQDPLEEAYR